MRRMTRRRKRWWRRKRRGEEEEEEEDGPYCTFTLHLLFALHLNTEARVFTNIIADLTCRLLLFLLLLLLPLPVHNLIRRSTDVRQSERATAWNIIHTMNANR